MSGESVSSLFDEPEERPDSPNSLFDEAEEFSDSPNSLFDEPEELPDSPNSLFGEAEELLAPDSPAYFLFNHQPEPATNPAYFLSNLPSEPANNNPVMGFVASEEQEGPQYGNFTNAFVPQHTEYLVGNYDQNMVNYNQQFASNSGYVGVSLDQPPSGSDEAIGDRNGSPGFEFFDNSEDDDQHGFQYADGPLDRSTSGAVQTDGNLRGLSEFGLSNCFAFTGPESQDPVAPLAYSANGTGETFGNSGSPSEVYNPYPVPTPQHFERQEPSGTYSAPESARPISPLSLPPACFAASQHFVGQELSGTQFAPGSVYPTPPSSFATSPRKSGIPPPAGPNQHDPPCPARRRKRRRGPPANSPPRTPITKTIGAGTNKEPKKRGRPKGSLTKKSIRDADGNQVTQWVENNIPDKHKNVVDHLRVREAGTRDGRSQILHLGGQQLAHGSSPFPSGGLQHPSVVVSRPRHRSLLPSS